MNVLLEVLWKSAAILGVALCVTALLWKRSADSRRLVLSATVVAVFLAALAWPFAPRLKVPAPGWLMRP
jgi:hypothetical protein